MVETDLKNEKNEKVEQAFENLRQITKRLKSKNKKLRNSLGVEKGYRIGNKIEGLSEDPYEALKQIRDRIGKRSKKIATRIAELEDGEAI
jgi:hypothetical protein